MGKKATAKDAKPSDEGSAPRTEADVNSAFDAKVAAARLQHAEEIAAIEVDRANALGDL